MTKRKKNNKNKIKKEHFRFDFPDETKKKIYGVLMFLIAVIISLSFFNLAGAAGRFFKQAGDYLIGKVFFILPVLFVIGGFVFLSQRHEPELKKHKSHIILAIIILILGIAGLLGIISYEKEIQQGGIAGSLVSSALIKIFGEIAAAVIFLATIAIGSIILWQINPFAFKEKEKVVEEAGEKIEEKPKEEISKTETQLNPRPEPEAVAPEDKTEFKPIKSLFKLKTKPLIFSPGEAYKPPPLDLLSKDEGSPTSGDIKVNSAIIRRTLQNFDIPVEMSEAYVGPTVTQYTFKPAEGVKLSKITGLNNDLSLALAAHPIRIEAPIPGRSLVGVEIPNRGRAKVGLRSLLEQPEFQNSPSKLCFSLGKDVAGNPVFTDLARMPHLLVAGSTGTGKTICLNNIIISLLYRNSPESLRFILVDPKRVEFAVYNEIPHLLSSVILTPQKTINALKWLIGEMERRFDVLSGTKARDIASYNDIVAKNQRNSEEKLETLPYIILIIDELADVMAARGREVEAGIVRLAQMARAVGIHLIVATQRPSVEVITGLIKANITSRVAFQVASQIDSRTILDTSGAEKLLGFGDMLFLSAEVSKPKRIQGAYVSEKEVKRVSDWLKKTETQPEALSEEKMKLAEEIDKGIGGTLGETSETVNSLDQALEQEENFYGEDPLYEEAKRIVFEARKASASLLQRRLRVGYARAARLIDTLEENGIVGPTEGAKPRDVYFPSEENYES